MSPSFLEAALGYAARGWRVFPLHGIVNGSCTCGNADCGSPGKHPLVRRGLYEATTDPHLIKEWWRRWRSANIGVATGSDSGIVVIDIDLPTAIGSLQPLMETGLRATVTGLTGGGGIHLFYATDDGELGNSAGRLPGIDHDLPGIDLRGNGGYVVGPPSVHSSGHRYEWLEAPTPLLAQPVWLKQPVRASVALGDVIKADFEGDGTPYGLAVMRDEIDRLGSAQVGTRNHELNRCAFVLAQLVGGGELHEGAVRSSMLGVALAIGLDEAEARQTMESAFEAGFRAPRVAPHRLKGDES